MVYWSHYSFLAFDFEVPILLHSSITYHITVYHRRSLIFSFHYSFIHAGRMGGEGSEDSTSSSARSSLLRVVRMRPTTGRSTPSSAASSQEPSLTPIEELPPLSPWITVTGEERLSTPPQSPQPSHAQLPAHDIAFSCNETDRSTGSADTNTLDNETEIDIHISHEELMSRRNSVLVNEENDDGVGIPGDITFWSTIRVIRRRQTETGEFRRTFTSPYPSHISPFSNTMMNQRLHHHQHLVD